MTNLKVHTFIQIFLIQTLLSFRAVNAVIYRPDPSSGLLGVLPPVTSPETYSPLERGLGAAKSKTGWCGEWRPIRLTPTWGSSAGHPGPEFPMGWAEAFDETDRHSSIFFCPILFFSLLFHRCWSWVHCLVSVLHAHLYLRVHFQGALPAPPVAATPANSLIFTNSDLTSNSQLPALHL